MKSGGLDLIGQFSFLFYNFTKFKPYENFCWFMNIFIEFFMEYPDIRIRYSVFIEPQEFEMDF